MISITTPLQIKNHPLNTSTSKNHWSFGKANRFPSPKTKYFFNLLPVAINLFMISEHVCQIEKPRLVLVEELCILKGINKFPSLENIKLFLILTIINIKKDSVLLQTDKILSLIISKKL